MIDDDPDDDPADIDGDDDPEDDDPADRRMWSAEARYGLVPADDEDDEETGRWDWPRPIGLARDPFEINPGFFDPLPDDVVAPFDDDLILDRDPSDDEDAPE